MNQHDAEAIVAIAALAAVADGRRDASEHAEIGEAATRLGLAGADNAVRQAAAGALGLRELAGRLSSPGAKRAAYDTAVAVCGADGAMDSRETAFLDELASALGIERGVAFQAVTSVTDAWNALSAPSAPSTVAGQGAASTPTPSHASSTVPSTASSAPSTSASGAATGTDLDAHILDQAILTAALEVLPDGLANMGILPLQLRLVRHVGQRHGHALDAASIKDLAATFGIGATAQIMEKMVRRTLGGLAGGLLGGMLGGAAGVAAGSAVTFASTYALGHAAQQYYAQGRTLSTADLKALFTRFQGEANSLYPRVQERITTMARSGSAESLMKAVRG